MIGRKEVLEGTIQAFNAKGLKFTMDDVAGILEVSKKTLYKVFRDKEELFLVMVDHIFDSIKESEQEILEDGSLDTMEKIRRILGVLPTGYREIDFRQLYLLKDKYPSIYRKVEQRLETGWEKTLELLEQGMQEGVIRKVRLPIVKLMLEAALEQFFQRDVLIRNGISYQEALDEVTGVIVDGIRVRKEAGFWSGEKEEA